ncbi:MAG: NAD(+)/NADH kinase, partial [Candidatus Dormibacteria bacterium]
HDPVLMDVVALNELAVKAQGVSVVRIRVEAEGDLLGEFDCDGVVVATATGSTAYALSAGGPPIDPRVRALVVVPLAPHAVITRGVVIPEALAVTICTRRGRVNAAADRRPEVALPDGARLTVRAGPDLHVVRFTGAPTFLGRLREKLHFGMPLKGPDRLGRTTDPSGGPT